MEKALGYVIAVYFTGFWTMLIWEAKQRNYSFDSVEQVGSVFGWFLVLPARGLRLALGRIRR